jgi:hypothetical protein
MCSIYAVILAYPTANLAALYNVSPQSSGFPHSRDFVNDTSVWVALLLLYPLLSADTLFF